MQKINKIPLELDPASTMFVLGRTEKRNYLIRLSITLFEPVEKDFLQISLEKTIQKYPYFFIRIVKKQNRLFTVPAKDIPEVTEKSPLDCLKLQGQSENCEAQVTYFDKTIILEYSHVVSDGKGGMEFLLSLTAEYLSLKYHERSIANSRPVIPICEQTVNGYKTHAKGLCGQKKSGIAYKIKGTPVPSSFVHITAFQLPVDVIKRRAKEQQVSVTEYMAALLCMGIWNIQQKAQRNQKCKKIRLAVPVNLRTRFPCNTMRNFVLNVYPEINSQTNTLNLPAVCKQIHQYMKNATDMKQLSGRCTSSTFVCDSFLMDIMPLSIKKRIVRTTLDFPFTGSSMTFSNLGVITLPSEMRSHIMDFGIVFSAKPETPYSCSLISLDEAMNLTFLRTIKEPLLEFQLEQILRKLNINYKKTIISNSRED